MTMQPTRTAGPGDKTRWAPPAVLTTLWRRLAPRERGALTLALAVVAGALLWAVALAPALRTLRSVQAEHRTLDAQLAQMRRLQAEARQLASQPRRNPDEAMQLLEATIRQRLGTGARYSVAGDQVTVTLTGAAPDVLAQWLTEARANARASAQQMQLRRSPAGLWEGRIVMALPPR